MKITEVLMAEHAVFHNLFDYIETSALKIRTLPEIKLLGATMERLHRAHSETEDELFIEPLEHCFEQIGHRETFHDEHEQIDRMLFAITQTKDLKRARQLLLNVVTASRKHFNKEERIIFPMAERTLKARTLSDLGDQWMKRRAAALK